MLQAWETWARLTGPSAPRMPPTFMVGAPRSGTTLASLHVLVTFELAYVPQISKRHSRSPLAHGRRALAREPWIPNYSNRFGESDQDAAPSDGWSLFERPFGSYREARAVHAARARSLPPLVAGFERMFDAPFFLKNNANSMRIEALAELFPDAFFVHVTRALPETVASLLEARALHGVRLGEWWSAAPPQFLAHTFSSEVEQAAVTVAGIETYVRERLARCAPQRSLEIRYDDFCGSPQQLTNWIRERYAEANVELRPRVGASPATRFKASCLSAERRERLERDIDAALARHGLREPSDTRASTVGDQRAQAFRSAGRGGNDE